MTQLILCRYGELWLKSKPVMNKFYSKLISNMHKMLDREQVDFKIMRKRNRAFVKTEDPEKVIEILKRTPGLISISPVPVEYVAAKNCISSQIGKFTKLGTKDPSSKVRSPLVLVNDNFGSVALERSIDGDINHDSLAVFVDPLKFEILA